MNLTSAPLLLRMDTISKVVIVPGYGLAVAKAQYATSEIVSILKSNGADVKFMIHPVAGRLPGQRLRRRAQPPHVQREHRDAPGRREVQPRGPAQRACQDAPVRVRGLSASLHGGGSTRPQAA